MLTLRIRPPLDAEVIVVGAGPAGAATATHLARAGVQTLLLDRQRFPRDKVCGDFVGPVALVELQRLGATNHAAYKRSNMISSAAVFLNGQQLISSPIPEVPGMPPYGRVVPRLELDQWIVAAARTAGAQLLENCRVRDYQADDEGVTVSLDQRGATRTLRARALVGADGSSSLVGRVLRGQPVPDEDRIIAVRAYFEGVAGPDEQADLYFSADSFPGYFWLFPTGAGHANVGVGMVLETLPPSEDHLKALLLRLIAEDTSIKARLQGAQMVGKVVGWPLTTYNPGLPLVGNRVLLTGDAAGLINPLNGEGIQYALLSGRWAAETLLPCLARNQLSTHALQPYAERVAHELRYDMALSGLIVQLIRNRSLNPVWMHALRIIVHRARVDPVYADLTGGVLAGLIPASSVLNARVIGGTLRQAAMTTGLDMIGNTVRGPNHLASLGRVATHAAVEIASTAALRPSAFLRWGFGVARSGTELALQASQHAFAPPGPEPPTSPPDDALHLRFSGKRPASH